MACNIIRALFSQEQLIYEWETVEVVSRSKGGPKVKLFDAVWLACKSQVPAQWHGGLDLTLASIGRYSLVVSLANSGRHCILAHYAEGRHLGGGDADGCKKRVPIHILSASYLVFSIPYNQYYSY